MKLFAVLLLITTSLTTKAEDKIKLYVNNEEITKIIEIYSKASGQKFVVDSTVRGKISIFNQTEVSLEEAYSQLSSALATNGFAISKQGDLNVVKNARATQRDYIEVSTAVPKMAPERMYTWVASLKNISARDVQSQIRILTSRYGELNINEKNNQLLITDWTANINRVAEIIKQIDKPADPAVAKIVAAAKKEHAEYHMKKMMMKEQNKNLNDKKSTTETN